MLRPDSEGNIRNNLDTFIRGGKAQGECGLYQMSCYEIEESNGVLFEINSAEARDTALQSRKVPLAVAGVPHAESRNTSFPMFNPTPISHSTSRTNPRPRHNGNDCRKIRITLIDPFFGSESRLGLAPFIKAKGESPPEAAALSYLPNCPLPGNQQIAREAGAASSIRNSGSVPAATEYPGYTVQAGVADRVIAGGTATTRSTTKPRQPSMTNTSERSCRTASAWISV